MPNRPCYNISCFRVFSLIALALLPSCLAAQTWELTSINYVGSINSQPAPNSFPEQYTYQDL